MSVMCFSGTGNKFYVHIHLAVVYQNMTIQSHCSECLVISETLWTKWIQIYISKLYCFSCSEPRIFTEYLNVTLYSISIHFPTDRVVSYKPQILQQALGQLVQLQPLLGRHLLLFWWWFESISYSLLHLLSV